MSKYAKEPDSVNPADALGENITPEIIMGIGYATIAKRDVTFAQSAYAGFAEKAGDSTKAELEAIAKKLPPEYEMIMCTDYMDDTKEHGYRAMVFINNQTKEIIVASSGTRFGMHEAGRSDLYSDACVMMSKKPPKMKSIETLNSMILDNLGNKAAEYKIHYTGHSLGASLSDLAAADMALKCRKRGINLGKPGEGQKISTMTFENPGSKKIIKKMYKKAGISFNEYSQDVDYKGVNNKRNLINQATSPAGQMWEIVPDGQNNEANLAQKAAVYLARKLNRILPVISRVLETFAMGGIIKQMKTHSLQHFDEVLCNSTGIVQNSPEMPKRAKWWLSELVTRCKKVCCRKTVESKIVDMKESKGDIGQQEFVIITEDSKLVTVSEVEARQAIASVIRAEGPEKTASSPLSGRSYGEIIKHRQSQAMPPIDRLQKSSSAPSLIGATQATVPDLEKVMLERTISKSAGLNSGRE